MVTVPLPLFFTPLKSINIVASPTLRVQSKSLIIPLPSTNLKVSSLLGSNAESSLPNSSEKPDHPEGGSDINPVKLALAKAMAYKKAIQSPSPEMVQNPLQESAEKSEELKLQVLKLEALESEDINNGKEEIPLSLKMAFEKATEYKKNKGVVEESDVVKGSEQNSVLKIANEGHLGNSVSSKKQELKISSINFVGLDFSEKKSSRTLPAGLVLVVPEGHIPEVELIVGDASKFGDGAAAASKPIQDEDMDVYKPKVSTWGVFPRPSNISKTYGGGRVIRPGEVLETAGDRAAKERRTKQLLAAYKSKIGLSIHPKLKSECVQALKDGDSLMDLGKLKEALPFYEKIMDKLAFQTELYGLAALQWSICQDSLSRMKYNVLCTHGLCNFYVPNEARTMYEKLQSHPNPQVSKKARQLNFGFQAMEIMKVTNSTLSPKNIGYQNYFDAFIRDIPNYRVEEAEVDEAVLSQALACMVLLLSPILIVVLIAAQKGLQS